MIEDQSLLYQPFYCEENIWWLAQRTDLFAGPTEVAFIFGVAGREPRVACWFQRAAEPYEAVLWDYHVVLAERRADAVYVWDLDTRLPLPCRGDHWLAATFQDSARVPAEFLPCFRVVMCDDYVRELASDRSHMRTPRGRWRKPPPSWPAPTGTGLVATNVADWSSQSTVVPGLILDRSALEARWSTSAPDQS